jgi:UPF0288 family protein (methanogenesis marker protein 3)
MSQFLQATAGADTRVMMFVDGENLAMRSGATLEDGLMSHVSYEGDVYVLLFSASRSNGPQDVIRRYYYISAPGDQLRREDIVEKFPCAVEAVHSQVATGQQLNHGTRHGR